LVFEGVRGDQGCDVMGSRRGEARARTGGERRAREKKRKKRNGVFRFCPSSLSSSRCFERPAQQEQDRRIGRSMTRLAARDRCIGLVGAFREGEEEDEGVF
jgi:hypothetical protein